jgi:hypothetical protein
MMFVCLCVVYYHNDILLPLYFVLQYLFVYFYFIVNALFVTFRKIWIP